MVKNTRKKQCISFYMSKNVAFLFATSDKFADNLFDKP